MQKKPWEKGTLDLQCLVENCILKLQSSFINFPLEIMMFLKSKVIKSHSKTRNFPNNSFTQRHSANTILKLIFHSPPTPTDEKRGSLRGREKAQETGKFHSLRRRLAGISE